jgi:2Fe-2S ferredoxin
VPKVTVMPLGVAFEVEDGESVFHAAVAGGYTWPTVCGGEGSCRTCYMRVLEGAENFEDPDEWEQEGLEDLPQAAEQNLRLACQALVRGDATVRRPGVKPPSSG